MPTVLKWQILRSTTPDRQTSGKKRTVSIMNENIFNNWTPKQIPAPRLWIQMESLLEICIMDVIPSSKTQEWALIPME